MKNKILEYTKDLVSIPSVSGNEKEILKYLENWMKDKGLEKITMTNDYVCGLKPGQNQTKALILTGHIDTVSPGNRNNWHSDPFTLAVDGDKLTGLGVSDMLLGIASMMCAVENCEQPTGDTWLVFNANEEVDGSGSAQFMMDFSHNYEDVSAVIAEPTELNRIEIGHRGNAFLKLTFLGTAGHASQQNNFKTSALHKANEFINQIDDIVKKLEGFTNEILGTPSFVPTGINTDPKKSANKTTDYTEIIIDLRTTPELDANLEDFLNNLGTEYNFKWQFMATPVESCLCSNDATVIQKLITLSEKYNLSPQVTVSPGATDQFFFQSKNINTVIFGPGEFSQAHQQNEYGYLSKAETAYRIYKDLISL